MIDGALFTRDFLLEGIRETERWRSLSDADVDVARFHAKQVLDALAARKYPNEARTEEDVVYPVLERIG